MRDNTTSWGSVAGWYDELIETDNDSYQKNVILPNLIRLIAPNEKMTLLDLACGQGYFARAMAQNGAHVTASDISEELVNAAKKYSGPHIDYIVSPSDDISYLASESTEIAMTVLAIQNIRSLPDTFAEVARVLRPRGRFILVLNHPCFRIPKHSSWQWDEANHNQYRRIDGYMNESKLDIDMNPGETNAKKKNFTVSFHRPLQTYFKALAKSGLAVTKLEEWISHKRSQKGARSAEEDRMRKEIPLFLCIEATKF